MVEKKPRKFGLTIPFHKLIQKYSDDAVEGGGILAKFVKAYSHILGISVYISQTFKICMNVIIFWNILTECFGFTN